MKSIHYLFRALPAILVLVGCSDPPTLGSGSSGLVDGVPVWLELPDKLLHCSPLPYASITQTIGPDGGTLVVGPHELSVPPGALSEQVSITAVVPSDEPYNVIRFAPAGLSFAHPAELTMSYANCSPVNDALPKRIAYTSDDLTDILDYLVSVNEPLTRRVTGRVEHFSTYAVAW